MIRKSHRIQTGVSVDEGSMFVKEIKANVNVTRCSGADAEMKLLFWLVLPKVLVPRLPNLLDFMARLVSITMSINGLIVQSAELLLFLDYFASGKLEIQTAAAFVSGVSNALSLYVLLLVIRCLVFAVVAMTIVIVL